MQLLSFDAADAAEELYAHAFWMPQHPASSRRSSGGDALSDSQDTESCKPRPGRILLKQETTVAPGMDVDIFMHPNRFLDLMALEDDHWDVLGAGVCDLPLDTHLPARWPVRLTNVPTRDASRETDVLVSTTDCSDCSSPQLGAAGGNHFTAGGQFSHNPSPDMKPSPFAPGSADWCALMDAEASVKSTGGISQARQQSSDSAWSDTLVENFAWACDGIQGDTFMDEPAPLAHSTQVASLPPSTPNVPLELRQAVWTPPHSSALDRTPVSSVLDHVSAALPTPLPMPAAAAPAAICSFSSAAAAVAAAVAAVQQAQQAIADHQGASEVLTPIKPQPSASLEGKCVAALLAPPPPPQPTAPVQATPSAAAAAASEECGSQAAPSSAGRQCSAATALLDLAAAAADVPDSPQPTPRGCSEEPCSPMSPSPSMGAGGVTLVSGPKSRKCIQRDYLRRKRAKDEELHITAKQLKAKVAELQEEVAALAAHNKALVLSSLKKRWAIGAPGSATSDEQDENRAVHGHAVEEPPLQGGMQLLSNGMGTANSVMFPTSPSLSEAKGDLTFMSDGARGDGPVLNAASIAADRAEDGLKSIAWESIVGKLRLTAKQKETLLVVHAKHSARYDAIMAERNSMARELQAHNLDTAAVLSRGYLISSCVTTQLTHNHEQAKVLLEQLSDECLKVLTPGQAAKSSDVVDFDAEALCRALLPKGRSADEKGSPQAKRRRV